MKIFDFINSRDVAEHLEKIGYRFSPVEAAWLIWQSKNHTVAEKHAAWKELIATSSDCSIEDLSEIGYTDGLHQYLRDYMDMENNLIHAFGENDGDCVYTYKMLLKADNDWCEDNDFFFRFEDAFAAFSEDIDLDPRFVEFVKSKVGKLGYKIYCRMTTDKKVVRIERSDYLQRDKDGDLFYHILDWDMRFPTPFKEGDILTTVSGKYKRLPPVGGTFVLCHGDTEADRENRRYNLINGRETKPYGYFVDSRCNVCRELIDDSVTNLIDCEIVRYELENEDRILIPIANYLKGKIDLVNMLNAHKIISCQHTLNVSEELLIFDKSTREAMGLCL